ncbi:hypothetical protein, partial [Xanthomonas oryzae]|uniref:hypothetical protein n=2 Tax=Xanthomonas oryzae TaxID=347 RepID=UPI001C53216E
SCMDAPHSEQIVSRICGALFRGSLTYYTVYKPDGAVLNSAYAGSNGISATTLNLPNLPMTGTYTVFVDPYYGETLSTQLTITSSK